MNGKGLVDLSDSELTSRAKDERLGFDRANAVAALVDRALDKPGLMGDALQAISMDRRIGFHKGAPIGWFGADRIFLSGNKAAVKALLEEMDSWESSEQEDLVRHWAGPIGLADLTSKLCNQYDWKPLYHVKD